MSFLLVANWKTSGDTRLVSAFLNALELYDRCDKYTAVLCPPMTALGYGLLSSSAVKFGAQNCFFGGKNCTGEVSPAMLKECGCSYVLLGHSERRAAFRESNSDIKVKAEGAIEAGLIPIICVGENKTERTGGMLKEVLVQQLQECVPSKGEVIIAYEPVWAIGGAIIPDLSEIREAIEVIRSQDSTYRVLYGGSVNATNVASLVTGINDLGGVLVGSASTTVTSFTDMLRNLLECL